MENTDENFRLMSIKWKILETSPGIQEEEEREHRSNICLDNGRTFSKIDKRHRTTPIL